MDAQLADKAEIKQKGKKEEQAEQKKKAKIVHTTGQRKDAVARATAVHGTGKVMVNAKPLELVEPEIARLRLMEPIAIAGDVARTLNIDVSVSGGGVMGQADAARQAIALALTGFDRKLKSQFLEYDRTLMVADARRNEPHKPSRSSAGGRRHKQRSKR